MRRDQLQWCMHMQHAAAMPMHMHMCTCTKSRRGQAGGRTEREIFFSLSAHEVERHANGAGKETARGIP